LRYDSELAIILFERPKIFNIYSMIPNIDLNIAEKLILQTLGKKQEMEILKKIEVERNEAKTGFINHTNFIEFYAFDCIVV